jgi:hypothetical protein
MGTGHSQMNLNIIKTYADFCSVIREHLPQHNFLFFFPRDAHQIMGFFYKKSMQVFMVGNPGGKGLYPTLINSHHQSQVGNQSFHKC